MAKRTISKVAEAAGVGIETVRFYERSGVLAKPPRPAEGWRQYPETSVWTIRYVKAAQAMGFSLQDCKRLLAGNARPPLFCRNVRVLATQKIEALDAEIDRLKQVRKEIKRFLIQCEKRQAGGTCPVFDNLNPAENATRRLLVK